MGILEHIRHLAEEMFAEFISQTNVIGENRKAAFAACVYYASSNEMRKRSLDEVGVAFNCKNIGRMSNKVHETMRSLPGWSSMLLDRTTTTGEDLVGRMVYCQPDIPRDKAFVVVRRCDEIWAILRSLRTVADKTQEGVNVVVIYVACKSRDIDIRAGAIMKACAEAGFHVCRHEFKDTLIKVVGAIASTK